MHGGCYDIIKFTYSVTLETVNRIYAKICFDS